MPRSPDEPISRPAAKATPPARSASAQTFSNSLQPRVSRACLLGLLAFVVYLSNWRPMGAWDSVPARLLPFSILREGNLDLDEFHWLRRLNPKPYFLRMGPRGHWRSRYTVALPALVTPLYAPAAWWLHRQHIDDDDVRFRLASVIMERISAALIAAVSVSLVFLSVCAWAPGAVATGLALAYAFGTSIWSIGSQALWQHGAAACALAGMSLFLIAPDTRRTAVTAGGLAALAVLVRPTMVIFALLALLFVWRERRVRLLPFLSLPLVGLAMLLAYNLRLVGLASGAYQPGQFKLPHPARFVGLLASPSRGLFVYTPAAALVVVGILQAVPGRPRWVAYLPLGLLGYLLLYSAWPGWWGGHCYGPRFLTDTLPAMVLCAVPAVQRWWRARAGRATVLLLVAWGIVVQVIGVYYDDRSWDALPTSVDSAPWRLWDWNDPQILRVARTGWHGWDLAPLLWQTLTAPQPALVRPLTPEELAGDIVLQDALPLQYGGRQTHVVHFQVTNRGGTTWPAFSDFGYLQVAFVYRWVQEGVMVKGEGGFVRLPRNLGAGESTSVRARIDVPARRGAYTLEIELVQVLNPQEGASGGAVLRVPVHVD
jgi:hypothetical protein